MVDSSRSLGDSVVCMIRAIADCVYALRSIKAGALIVTGGYTLNVRGTVCIVSCLLLVAYQLFLASHTSSVHLSKEASKALSACIEKDGPRPRPHADVRF